MKRVFILLAIAIAVSAGVAIIALQWSKPAPHGLPALQFETAAGQSVALQNLAGQPVLVVFWASTCKPCMRELPELKAIYAEYSPKGLAMFGVSMFYDAPAEVMKAVQRHDIPYPVVFDLGRQWLSGFDVEPVTPTLILVAPDGRHLVRHHGMTNFARLRETLDHITRS